MITYKNVSLNKPLPETNPIKKARQISKKKYCATKTNMLNSVILSNECHNFSYCVKLENIASKAKTPRSLNIGNTISEYSCMNRIGISINANA